MKKFFALSAVGAVVLNAAFFGMAHAAGTLAAPSGLSLAGATPTSIALSWYVPSDSQGTITSYTIYRNGAQIATINPGTYVDTGVNSSGFAYFLDTNLSPSTSYTYAVSAKDSAGAVSPQSAPFKASTLVQPVSNVQQWSLGDYRSSSTSLSDINWPSLTHISYFCAHVNSDGTITLDDNTGAANLVSAAHLHNVKALMALCGGTNPDTIGAAIANNLNTLIDSVKNTVNTYGFDGVDIDWEGSSINYANYATFLADLRAAFGTSKLLSAYTAEWMGPSNWTALYPYLDRVNVMAYDLEDPGFVFYNSPLYSVNGGYSIDSEIQAFLGAGIPAAKLNMGFPLYGYIVQGGCQDANCAQGMTAPLQTWTTGPSFTAATYRYLAENYNLATTSSNTAWHWDVYTDVPYLSISSSNPANDMFITYENAQSIRDKINYAQANGLGGWSMWTVGQDTMASGVTPTQQYPLSSVIAEELAVNAKTSAQNTSSPSAIPVPAENSSPAQTASVSPPAGTTPHLPDGSLITGPDGVKVYIVNAAGYKRHIFNPAVFDMYANLSWNAIQQVSQTTLDAYKTSDLYRVAGQSAVYQVTENANGTASKQWLDMTTAQFLACGYSPNQIFTVNQQEADYYPTAGSMLATSCSSLPQPSPNTATSSATPAATNASSGGLTQDLSYGNNNSQVQLLQTELQDLGFFPQDVTPNGNFGPITLQSVESFQVKYGIATPGTPGYGDVGPETRGELNKLFPNS
ncbi:glycosyl hydrolase family 18 protein [Patescibacteria group bacterium]|nr:glycosyl hydrolase family 18 protein [Patescibacteria group bacterium]